jgi:glycosyltransferase involved in cell wall biosynthesis
VRLLYLSADPGVPVLGHKGASVHLRELAAALAEAGAEVEIASPRVEPEGDVLGAPARLWPIAPVLPKALADRHVLLDAVDAQAHELTRLAVELEVEAIYERFSLFSAAGARAADALGLPHALEVNAPLREEAARFRTLPHPDEAAAIEREVFAATGRLLAVSAGLAEILAGAGVPADRVEVLPNAVAAARFAPPRRDPERFVAGFAGSLKPWHGIDTLVEALLLVPSVHLEVAGEGPLEPLLERLPTDRTTIHGAVPHERALEIMSGWDAGLAPYSPSERFWFSSLKVLEYMAAGSCPVVSDLGDARAVLGDGSRGVLVAPGDPAALAAALDGLAADRERARRLGERARGWVRTERSWSRNARRVLDALLPAAVGEAA